jgi:hypothetical protein
VPALFERALGDAWSELDDHIQKRYGLVEDEERIAVASGVMEEIGGGFLATPALWLGTFDDFLFPESGTNVDFTMRSVPFIDVNGYEGLLLERDFDTNPQRTFVDTVRWNPHRGCITDFLGRSGHVVSDLHLEVEDGSLALHLGQQWIRIRHRYIPLPGPTAVEGTLRDHYDTDDDRFVVDAEIKNLTGTVFSYRGHFENSFSNSDADAEARPLSDARLPGEPH